MPEFSTGFTEDFHGNELHQFANHPWNVLRMRWRCAAHDRRVIWFKPSRSAASLVVSSLSPVFFVLVGIALCLLYCNLLLAALLLARCDTRTQDQTRSLGYKRSESGVHFLVKERKAERLLMDWANTETIYPLAATMTPAPWPEAVRQSVKKTDDAIRRLIAHYPEVFQSLPPEPPLPQGAPTTIPTSHWGAIAHVQHFLRLAWNASDLRSREWFLYKARDEWRSYTVFLPLFDARARKGGEIARYSEEELRLRNSPPELDSFERALYHFHRMAVRAKRCLNPECPAPYFFAEKPSYKYCGSKCSAPSQREQKRLWWQNNRGKGKSQ